MSFSCAIGLAAALGASWTDVPAYPRAVPIPIGDEIRVGAEVLRIAFFTTEDPVEEVARYFLRRWEALGLPTAVDEPALDQRVVSAFRTRSGLQQSVVLHRRSGKTVGFAAVRDLWTDGSAAAAAELFSPGEGVLWVADVGTRDGETFAQHRTALLERALQTAQAEIADQLGSLGYSLVRTVGPPPSGTRHLTLEHSRGDRRVITQLAEVGDGVALVQECLGCAPPRAAAEPSGEVRRRVEP